MTERGAPQRTLFGVGKKGKFVLSIINYCSGGVFQTAVVDVLYMARDLCSTVR